MQKFKGIFSYIAKIAITVALLVFLLRKVNIARILEVIRGLNIYFFVVIVFIFIFLVLLCIIRWYLLLKIADVKVPFKRVIIAYSIAQLLNMLPTGAIGGDAARGFDIFEYAEDKSRIFATVIIDRLSGFVSMALVSLFAIVAGYRFINNNAVLITFAILLAMVVFILVVGFSRRAFRLFAFFFNKLPLIKDKLLQLNESMIFFRDKKIKLIENVAISLLIRLGVIMIFYFIAVALNQRVGILYFFIFVPIIEAISSVPITIGGLGVRDNVTASFFVKVGLNPDVAVSISLINFFLIVLMAFIGGIIYVLTLHTRRV